VFDFSIGNPVMEPPAEFFAEMKKLANAASSGVHGYMSNAGYVETRAAVARQISAEIGMQFSSEDIIMTCGAAGGLNVILKSILNPGDEVIIFSPFFSEFVNYIDNHGGIVKILPGDSSFIPDLAALESSLSQKTKAVLLNSPNNPTGVVYGNDFIIALTDLLKRKEKEFSRPIFLINDEAYRKLLYDGMQFPFIQPYYENSLTVNSHSKDLSLPGERIGYITVNPQCYLHDDLIAALVYSNRTLGFVNAPALMQRIVTKLQNVTIALEEYEKKRDFLYENLTRIGYQVVKPGGAFYIFPKAPIDDDFAFVAELRKWNILTVPGTGFGAPGYFRIAYCVGPSTVENSISGFTKAFEKFN
ncbi:MAG TPA: pyridoxal phosphate-dependent aminotransferase, partial [Dehalococcoidia bacterium]|nr:pyridoxal phosphate-dependent aminotransferase [Dehalococcoidia bacterium]